MATHLEYSKNYSHFTRVTSIGLRIFYLYANNMVGRSGVQFWGKKRVFHSKYRYAKHNVGVNQPPVWVKIPNIAYMQSIILARKFLRHKYTLETRKSYTRKKFYPGKVTEELKKRLDVKKLSIKFAGRRHRSNTGVQSQDQNQSSSSKNNLKAKNESKLISSAENTKQQNKKTFKSKDPTEAIENLTIQDIRAAFRTSDVIEILANSKAFSKDATNNVCSLQVSLMEIMRIGVYRHDWALVSKCAEGLADESKRNYRSAYWILWNGGFLALVNTYRNDVNRILELGLQMRSLMCAYPKRMAVEVATWLTQHGYFKKGIEIIESWHQQWGQKIIYLTKVHKENPKRYQIELLSSLFLAARSYALWKKNIDLFQRGRCDEMSPRRSGERALIEFQLVAEWAEKSCAEITIFIEPLIELTIEFKTEFDARKIFLNYAENHRRNYVLQELYLTFLEKYFPFLEEEIEIFTEYRKLYAFKKRDSTADLLRLRHWRDNILRSSNETTFKSVRIPTHNS